MARRSSAGVARISRNPEGVAVLGSISTTIADPSGWGAAEWLVLATALTSVLGVASALVVQLVRMRAENTSQHAEGRALVTDVRDRLLDLHETVDRVDGKVDRLAERQERHESVKHRDRRRW